MPSFTPKIITFLKSKALLSRIPINCNPCNGSPLNGIISFEITFSISAESVLIFVANGKSFNNLSTTSIDLSKVIEISMSNLLLFSILDFFISDDKLLIFSKTICVSELNLKKPLNFSFERNCII